ncbi:MAG TPA: TolC family protein [Gemmatimonadota bacterium]|nr:TolC family protein [Gemmatimonadota bacterium]
MVPPLEGVRRIALEEGLILFEQQNLDLRIAREEAAAARARALSAGALQNPNLAATREHLSDGDRDYDEMVVTLNQTLEIGGQRGLRRDAAGGAADAAEARLEAERLRLRFEVRRTFILAALAEGDLGRLEETTLVVRQVEQAGQARFAEGDISDFDRQRLQVERARYEDLLAQARLRLTQAGRELTLLVSPDSIAADEILLPLYPLDSLAVPIPRSVRDTVPPGAADRPDVRAARAEIEAARDRLALADRERIPDITIAGGYKDQSDGLQGGVIGLSVPIPLLDRNAGRIAEAQADLSNAEARAGLVLRRAEADVRRAWENYRSLVRRIEQVERDLLAGTVGLLETARIAYAEGEMSLVELLDAAEAYHASRELAADLHARYLIAMYDLDRATGASTIIRATSPTEDQP